MFSLKKHQLGNLLNDPTVRAFLAAPPRKNAPLRAAVAAASASAVRQHAPTASVRAPVPRRSPAWHGKVRSYVDAGKKQKAAGKKFKSNLVKARPALKQLAAASRRGVNINKLIAQADAAWHDFILPSNNPLQRKIKRAEFYRTRNFVLHELEERLKRHNSRAAEILKNINRRKNNIVSSMNAGNKVNRYITWRQAVALNQGGNRKNIGKRYRGPSPSPPRPSPRSPRRRTPPELRGIGASNIANYLVRRGLRV
jgi:hypothetical protein